MLYKVSSNCDDVDDDKFGAYLDIFTIPLEVRPEICNASGNKDSSSGVWAEVNKKKDLTVNTPCPQN